MQHGYSWHRIGNLEQTAQPADTLSTNGKYGDSQAKIFSF